MQLIEAKDYYANFVLFCKKRDVKAMMNGVLFPVQWINDNNNTSGLLDEEGNHFLAHNKDLTFLIEVPVNS